MSVLNRIVLVRHGETVGNSSVRFHGRGDVPLSDEGRRQMRAAARQIPGEGFDRVVASSLQRAWQAAEIVAPGMPVSLEPDFCEIDFGRWEGLTKQEIESQDPILFEDWQTKAAGFEFPEGEKRADFRARVHRGLGRLLAGDARQIIVVAHKGIVREIVKELVGTDLPAAEPQLAAVLQVTRDAGGHWLLGRRSSNPPDLGDAPTATAP